MNTPDSNLRISRMDQVAELLPYLLNHHPDNAIVFHAPGPNLHEGPTMTCPLPEDPAEWQATAESAARQFVGRARFERRTLDEGIIIYLCHEPRTGQTPEDTAALLAPLAELLRNTLRDHTNGILRTMGLVDNRWWWYECTIDGCCEGEPLPSPDDPDSVAAQMARAGRTPAPRIQDIVKEFRAVPDPDFLKQLRTAVRRFDERCLTRFGRDATLMATCTQIDAAMNQFRDGATILSPALAAQLMAGIQDPGAMDAGLALSHDDNLPHARRLWAYLARQCAKPFASHAAPLLTLFAFATWQQGDLPTTEFALHEALDVDSDYYLADAIHIAILDGEASQELLAAARKDHAQRLRRLQHTVPIIDEYLPTDTHADHYRKALDTAIVTLTDQISTDTGQTATRYSTIDIVHAALADSRGGRTQLPDDIAARIILGVQDPQTRDVALSTGEEDDLPHERQLWAYLARHCVPPHTDKMPPLLTLFAWVAWRQGDTSTARHALADALSIDPGYLLAGLMLGGIRKDNGLELFLKTYRRAAERFAADRPDFDAF